MENEQLNVRFGLEKQELTHNFGPLTFLEA
jgi:hypothetical protein